MGNAIIICLLLLFALLALRETKKRLKGGCCGGGDEPVKIKPQDANPSHYSHKTLVYIEGMTCAHCRARVENEFHSHPGLLAKVDLKKKCATVWSKQPLSRETVEAIVKKSGYTFVRSVHA